ncbi:MAG: translation initiation factor IF-2 [Desulfovibrio sp.]|nr:translation initiation factor IF-2 [Desulfovibrio sp.]
MSLMWWAIAGAVMLAGLVFCFRIMRRGMSTLDDDRGKFLARIRDGEHKLEEEQKQVAADEHMALMRAAVEDLLRLADSPPGYRMETAGRNILLHTPKGTWRLELAMREIGLKSRQKVLHGRPRWLLSGPGHEEQHADAASVMRSLDAHLRAEGELAPEPPHLARRLEPGTQAQRRASRPGTHTAAPEGRKRRTGLVASAKGLPAQASKKAR